MADHADHSTSLRARQETARTEVGHTTVPSTTARALVALFVTCLAAVPLFEWLGTLRASEPEAAESAWSHLARLPQAISVSVAQADAAQTSPWGRTVIANRGVLAALDAFETALEDESRIGRLLRPAAQVALSRWLGVGNEQVYRGRDGWLFYRPDVDYVTGRGFLDPRVLDRRVTGASEWGEPPQPDPREAIVRFKDDLEARGITLVVMPTPVKTTIHPDRLAARFADWPAPLQNASYAAFVEDLRREGVIVFELAQAFVDARRSKGPPQPSPPYLATDTHWRPEMVERAAESLGDLLTREVTLPATAAPGYRTTRRRVENTGDITLMLDLPPDQRLYPPESVWLRRVLQPDGTPWRPSRSADVLILGDSFTNIYALESMGWGDAAGFAEQLSYVLQRPVDRLAQNDDGAFATRQMLRRGLGGAADRLEGRRVVIYQFATRELAFGDWKVIPLE